ncbi:MAG: cysteine desulfurase / selenocysteine lyase, partial [Mycobacterium sp.]|nr:cysteine desulfurase / selenocysteine lyase [Mycobacterium sp.]
MSTSEYRSVEAESDLPIGAAELAALANQLFATSFRPGPDSPPLTAPVAPRGSAPDATAATSAGTAAVGAANPLTPVQFTPARDVYVPAPTSPAPDGIPQTVPVAPRGSAPDTTAAPSAGYTVGSALDPYAVPSSGIVSTVPGVLAGSPPSAPVAPRGSAPDTTAAPSAGYTVGSALDPYAVPTSGIVSTVPGVLAGSPPSAPVAPRGSAPSWPSSAPSVADLGWTGAPTAAPAGSSTTGDEANYYFLSGSPSVATPEPVPQLPDNHEVFDVNAVRADFPILRETVNGKPLIWFDNAATTQKPQAVIDRLAYFYAHENSNIHRAAHELAARATDAYEEARDTVRRFIGASKSEEIIFVRGTTEAINLVAYAWGGKHLGPGDEIVITHLEHHANIVPWQILSQQTGA